MSARDRLSILEGAQALGGARPGRRQCGRAQEWHNKQRAVAGVQDDVLKGVARFMEEVRDLQRLAPLRGNANRCLTHSDRLGADALRSVRRSCRRWRGVGTVDAVC